MDRLLTEHFGQVAVAESTTNSDSEREDNFESNECTSPDSLIEKRISELATLHDDGESDDDTEIAESNVECQDFNLQFTCNCLKNCFTTFSDIEINDNIFSMREMSKVEKEMFVMGLLQKGTFGQITQRKTERKRARFSYSFRGETICRDAFLTIFDLSNKVLSNIITHMNKNGVTQRVHGNKDRKPTHALKFIEIENAVKFIRNYADEFGIPQPAAPSGSDGIPPIYLPASDTKRAIHNKYYESCAECNIRPLKISSFEDAWLKCVPHIRISSPRDDVCQKCERLRKEIADARTEDEKL